MTAWTPQKCRQDWTLRLSDMKAVKESEATSMCRAASVLDWFKLQTCSSCEWAVSASTEANLAWTSEGNGSHARH